MLLLRKPKTFKMRSRAASPGGQLETGRIIEPQSGEKSIIFPSNLLKFSFNRFASVGAFRKVNDQRGVEVA